MQAHGRASRHPTRRAVLAAFLVFAAAPIARAQSDGQDRETIAVAKREAGFAAPLTLAMARVVLRPGAASWTPVHAGVRLIAVESGVLGITVEAPYRAPLTAAELSIAAAPPEPREEILLPAGTVMTFGARGVTSVRNPGARSTVVLDAVVFHGEPRPLARAFTTESGVSFQLLAAATAAEAPAGKAVVTLERLRLPAGALPAESSAGLSLLYLEAGELELVPLAGEVAAARAAAAAPYALPGSMQNIATGERQPMTAGGVIFLPLDAAASISNTSRRTAQLLALTLCPAD